MALAALRGVAPGRAASVVALYEGRGENWCVYSAETRCCLVRGRAEDVSPGALLAAGAAPCDGDLVLATGTQCTLNGSALVRMRRARAVSDRRGGSADEASDAPAKLETKLEKKRAQKKRGMKPKQRRNLYGGLEH